MGRVETIAVDLIYHIKHVFLDVPKVLPLEEDLLIVLSFLAKSNKSRSQNNKG